MLDALDGRIDSGMIVRPDSLERSVAAARSVLRDRFGYSAFRPGQESAVDAVLQGRDTLVVLPTGGGKSVCYQVPALMLPGVTVVISPLISLMKDQVDSLEGHGVAATFVNSTLRAGQISDRLARVQRGEVKLLYVAPERFDTGTFADRLRENGIGVSLLAVDEAHCISEWGHDFRPSYLRLAEVRARLGAPPTVALTATATPHVRRDITTQLKLRSPHVVITGFDRSNLRYEVVSLRTESAKDDALAHAIAKSEGSSIVYAPTRRTVDRLTGLLEKARIKAAAYHAGLDERRRHEVQDAFMREEVRVIVATNAFGMGIDKSNVRLVLHYAMPGSLEAYYQEAGRAGRDGEFAQCVLLHAFQDRFTHEFFIKSGFPERSVVEAVYDLLRKTSERSGGSDLQDIASRLTMKTSEREVESALRILQEAGALTNESDGSGRRVFVRLLATPERIRRELNAESDARELGMLRALWRAVGPALNEGAVIDLDGLPPGLSATSGAQEILRSVESRQFIELRAVAPGARLTQPRRVLGAFRIDWFALDRRRKADLEKLATMQRYAYTKSCRRGFVLRYFGDQAARSSCSGCDNCVGATIRIDEASDEAVPKRPKPRSQRAAQGGDGSADAAELTGADQALLARLRDLRSRIAKQDAVPAYVVFTDRSLAEMAVRRPRTQIQMLDVRGVGGAKLERYGGRFLAEINGFDESETA